MKPQEITASPIHILHEKRLAGDITTVAITEAVMARRAQTETSVRAYLHETPEAQCLEQAAAADEKIRRGNPVDPVEGMPIGIKDNFNIQRVPLTCASKILQGYTSPYESTVTGKLAERRYNLTGKMNMDEFAMGSSTENSGFFPTSNPWDLARVPGGSSGGSAAAVAVGSALAALGSDTGGSIRQPAAFTGTVGIKPTYGFCSRYGIVAYASSFDQAGPITKDVYDAALLLERIGGYDPLDSTSLDTPVPKLTENLQKGADGLRIGYIRNLDLNACDPEISKNFEDSLALFTKNGITPEPIDIEDLEHAIAVYYIIACSEASSNLGRYDGIRYGYRSPTAEKVHDVFTRSRDEGFGAEVKLRILLGTFALSTGYYDAYYAKAKTIQATYRRRFATVFDKVDVLLSPVSPVLPFKKNEKMDNPLQMYLADAFTVLVNVAGLPAISVPSGFSAGKLPIGLQMIGGRLSEEKLLRAAYWFEQHRQLVYPALPVY